MSTLYWVRVSSFLNANILYSTYRTVSSLSPCTIEIEKKLGIDLTAFSNLKQQQASGASEVAVVKTEAAVKPEPQVAPQPPIG